MPPGGEQSTATWNATELDETAIHERHATAGDDIPNGFGDEHLARCRHTREPSPKVDRESSKPFVLELALTGVHAGTNLQPQIEDLTMESASEGHGERRELERRQETVSSCVDLSAAERL
jgi:hypothetical protein